MNLDLHQFTAFALEGSGVLPGEQEITSTLTVAVVARGSRSARGGGSTAKVAVGREYKPWPLLAAVHPASAAALTLTF